MNTNSDCPAVLYLHLRIFVAGGKFRIQDPKRVLSDFGSKFQCIIVYSTISTSRGHYTLRTYLNARGWAFPTNSMIFVHASEMFHQLADL